MKQPPIGKYFIATAYWYTYSTDGDAHERGPAEIIGIRNNKDYVTFIHKGQPYRDEKLSRYISWRLLNLDVRARTEERDAASAAIFANALSGQKVG